MKLLAVFLLVSTVVVQATHFGSIQTSITCPSGWTLINSRCFLYVRYKMNWVDAEKNCQSIGANLASIHNADENNRVQNLIVASSGYESTVAWIGGSDAQQMNTWLWSDGSRMSYTNWCQRLSNFHKHCIVIKYSGAAQQKCWDDYDCHENGLPSVCAKKG